MFFERFAINLCQLLHFERIILFNLIQNDSVHEPQSSFHVNFYFWNQMWFLFTDLINFQIQYLIRFVTSRIRRMREGNIFSLSTLVCGGGGGTPSQVCGWGVLQTWGVPHLGGGILSQVWGYPISGLGGEGTHPRSGWWGVPRVPPN